MRKMIKCKRCGEEKPHHGHGFCHTCYQHETGLRTPMNENKSCSSYLGVHITEKLLLKRFKNAKEMPTGNKGYDFICDKCYKIDAKASISHKRSKNSNKFLFGIKENQIADYFCCIAYDNREDLNIINAWLIPSDAITIQGNKINELTGLSISLNQFDYWKQYEMDINILDECCTKKVNYI